MVTALHIRSSMREARDTGQAREIRVRRQCLVCDEVEELWEPAITDQIGPACNRCHAPTERIAELERRHLSRAVNPHAAGATSLVQPRTRAGPARVPDDGCSPSRE